MSVCGPGVLIVVDERTEVLAERITEVERMEL